MQTSKLTGQTFRSTEVFKSIATCKGRIFIIYRKGLQFSKLEKFVFDLKMQKNLSCYSKAQVDSESQSKNIEEK